MLRQGTGTPGTRVQVSSAADGSIAAEAISSVACYGGGTGAVGCGGRAPSAAAMAVQAARKGREDEEGGREGGREGGGVCSPLANSSSFLSTHAKSLDKAPRLAPSRTVIRPEVARGYLDSQSQAAMGQMSRNDVGGWGVCPSICYPTNLGRPHGRAAGQRGLAHCARGRLKSQRPRQGAQGPRLADRCPEHMACFA